MRLKFSLGPADSSNSSVGSVWERIYKWGHQLLWDKCTTSLLVHNSDSSHTCFAKRLVYKLTMKMHSHKLKTDQDGICRTSKALSAQIWQGSCAKACEEFNCQIGTEDYLWKTQGWKGFEQSEFDPFHFIEMALLGCLCWLYYFCQQGRITRKITSLKVQSNKVSHSFRNLNEGEDEFS